MWRFLKKLEIELPYDLAIPLLGIHTEETRRERDTCTPMFIAALFIIARTWKRPRCPSVDEWIRKLWYIYIMEYYSAIKKNAFESVLMRWMKLEPMAFPVVMYVCKSCTVKKAECQRIDAFELWCWRRLLRVSWTARRSNQTILKEISPGFSLEGMLLKLKLQYFGHLM